MKNSNSIILFNQKQKCVMYENIVHLNLLNIISEQSIKIQIELRN